MTKHTPITGTEITDKSGSLFERADSAFGLESLDTAAVPKNLPRAKKPAIKAPAGAVAPQAPLARQATLPQTETRTAPAPAEPAVALGGPLAEIDRELLREQRLLVPEEPVTGLLEEFRIIKRELLADARESRDPAARRVLLSSPHEGEGKTFCAANLAIALAAERNVEVLLIDADVMKPSITQTFGIEETKGFMDAIADPAIAPEELAIKTDIDGLFIMPAGSRSALDTEYLASARTGEVLDRLTRGAPNRYIIFDTPPALAASPAAELAAYVGQALLIVRADETSRAAIDDAQKLLSACHDLKLLLNAAQFSPSGRRFGNYRKGDEA
ncbi:MAG: AAA family ATPase [Pseudomonadota bacterium]